ncbi:MAG: bifunctional aspartate kinase/homoserine dehydrogenase I [Chitinophagales bacterium]
MKVLKFGGTSVGSAEAFQLVAKIVQQQKEDVCVVVSAMGGVTNLLIQAGQQAKNKDEKYVDTFLLIKQKHIDAINTLFAWENRTAILSEIIVRLNEINSFLEGIYLLGDLSEKSLAQLSSFGELLSSYILYQYVKQQTNNETHLLDATVLIKVEGNYLGVKLNQNLSYKNIKKAIKTGVHIMPGFICSNEANEICTLGRGGSDYTAAIIAAACSAKVLEIWTDVSGMYTTNPKLVSSAFPIKHISYQEAMELSHFGAKVIYPPTIQPVLDLKIPILIKNTFDASGAFTEISHKVNNQSVVSGISHIEGIALLTLEGAGMVGVPGFSMRLFKTLAEQKINVIFITQASSEHSICFGILQEETAKAQKSIEEEFAYELSLGKINPLILENDLAIVALVGDNMKNHQGISGKMFNTLGKNNINIRAIAQGASERNISTVIHKKHISKALNVLHEAFFEDHRTQLNVFVIGVGNVGAKLLNQFEQQKEYLSKSMHLNLNVVGLANSKTMFFDEESINLTNWEKLLKQGKDFDVKRFLSEIKKRNLPNSIVVDNTASEQISDAYALFLKESIALITCNKIACSSSLHNYQYLKTLARKYNAPFLYETNVGAGLPIINTLQNLIASGDKIIEIQAVLSGSLNFIFNNYNATTSFAQIVEEAGKQGYTEPDPRIDLSGVDVMRKILILARESGASIEMDDIKSVSFLPEKALKSKSVADFMQTLQEEEKHFKNLYTKATNKNAQLKVVAKYTEKGAQLALEEILPENPFYNLKGKDNMVLFLCRKI